MLAMGLGVVETMTTDTLMMCHDVGKMNDNRAFFMIQRAGLMAHWAKGWLFKEGCGGRRTLVGFVFWHCWTGDENFDERRSFSLPHLSQLGERERLGQEIGVGYTKFNPNIPFYVTRPLPPFSCFCLSLLLFPFFPLRMFTSSFLFFSSQNRTIRFTKTPHLVPGFCLMLLILLVTVSVTLSLSQVKRR